VSRAARVLIAVAVVFAASGCVASVRSDGIASLQIVRLDIPANARGIPRQWWVKSTNSPAAILAAALPRCAEQYLVKFKPKYQVAARNGDGTETTSLVWGEYVKIEGVSFRCRSVHLGLAMV